MLAINGSTSLNEQSSKSEKVNWKYWSKQVISILSKQEAYSLVDRNTADEVSLICLLARHNRRRDAGTVASSSPSYVNTRDTSLPKQLFLEALLFCNFTSSSFLSWRTISSKYQLFHYSFVMPYFYTFLEDSAIRTFQFRIHYLLMFPLTSVLLSW